ncbi:hypothetical protein CRG98_019878 [Punica granatum]|uniref:Uncharacterized protein n=1 Tax=Punica granatum TaxID=22663 RepID=A0A2I0JTW4_PUNGR|nr:hypothetical protein CRG98_019878 [Punica granatum]
MRALTRVHFRVRTMTIENTIGHPYRAQKTTEETRRASDPGSIEVDSLRYYSLQALDPGSAGVGTAALFIVGISECIQYGTLKIPYDTKTTNVIFVPIPEIICLSRGILEHSQTAFLMGLLGLSLYWQINGTQRQAWPYSRVTGTRE